MSYASTILADSPLGYWRLNESSGNLAHDLSGNGYTAQLSGGFTLSQPGALVNDSDTAIAFAGSGTLSFPSSLRVYTLPALTLEFWINLGLGAGWQYITVTCDGSTTTTYVNSSVSATGSAATIEIGSLFDFVGSYLGASLDEVALYSTVLSPVQIVRHYSIGQISTQNQPLPVGTSPLSYLGASVVPVIPVGYYAVNGTRLDSQPVICTAPQTLAGNVLPAGSTFTLLFSSPSTLTQNLLTDGTTVSLTFALSGGTMVTTLVKLAASLATVTSSTLYALRAFGGPVLLSGGGMTLTTYTVVCTLLATFPFSTRVIATQFF